MANKKNNPAEAASNNTEAVKAVSKKEAVENPTVKRQRIAKELRDKRAKEAAKVAKAKEAADKDAKSKQEKAADKTPAKDTRKLFKDDRGLTFAFKHSAPKSLNIDGKSTPVKEIIENEEVMLELVYGNSNFIEQIH